MASTPAQFAHRARSFAVDLQQVEKRAVGGAALMVKNTALGELRQAVGSDLRMSGVGKRGAKVGVRYDQRAGSATAVVRATGPVHLIEWDTKAHQLPKQRKRTRQGLAAKRSYAVIPGVGVRSSVQHPGTKGKRPWGKAIDKATRKVGPVVQAETSKAMRRVFGH